MTGPHARLVKGRECPTHHPEAASLVFSLQGGKGNPHCFAGGEICHWNWNMSAPLMQESGEVSCIWVYKPATESGHWFIGVSVVSSDWQRISMISGGSFSCHLPPDPFNGGACDWNVDLHNFNDISKCLLNGSMAEEGGGGGERT